MRKAIKKIMHEGKVYYSVPDAARYLGTTATKIRQIMIAKLEWTQARVNGKLIVSADSLLAYKNEISKPETKPQSSRTLL